MDLYLIHYPISLKAVDKIEGSGWFHDPNDPHPRMHIDEGVTYQQTWEAMEALVNAGLVRNIGCSNIGTDKLMDVIKYSKVKPAVLQVEMHPHLSQENLLRFARMNGI